MNECAANARWHRFGTVDFGEGVNLVAVLPKLLVAAPGGRAPVTVVRRKGGLYVIAGTLVLAKLERERSRAPSWCRVDRVNFGDGCVRRFESMEAVLEWADSALAGCFERELFESIVL